MGVDPGTDASTEELTERFDKVHQHTSHGEHEGEPDPATGAIMTRTQTVGEAMWTTTRTQMRTNQ